MFDYKVNQQIKADNIIVINDQKQNLGKQPLAEALKLAETAGLDLVLISDNPAVCKLIDYQKFLYETKKRLKAQQKASREEAVREKEIRFGATIAPHDLEVKSKKVKELLDEGFRVKLSCKLRGRAQHNQKPHVIEIFNTIYKDGKNTSEVPVDFVRAYDNIVFGVITP